MDKSEIYIKMCDCEEIQSQQENVGGVSFFWVRGDIYNHDTGEFLYKDEREIYLPSQDQLQEMVELTGYHFTFSESFSENNPKQLVWEGERHIGRWYVRGFSMEQLWLAFVMKELHNKTWDSVKEEWKNE